VAIWPGFPRRSYALRGDDHRAASRVPFSLPGSKAADLIGKKPSMVKRGEDRALKKIGDFQQIEGSPRCFE
jgi:hypothetical protein